MVQKWEKSVGALRQRYLQVIGVHNAEAHLTKDQCVVDALESVTGEDAPLPIRVKRARDRVTKSVLEFDNAWKETYKQRKQLINLDPSIESQHASETHAIKNLIRDARRSNTAFGQALRDRPFQVVQLSGKEVREAVKDGNDVIIIGRFLGLEGGHAAHVRTLGPVLVDKLVPIVPLFFPKDSPVTSVIFPKDSQKKEDMNLWIAKKEGLSPHRKLR